MDPRLHTGLTDAPLRVDAAHAFLADPAAGAVVVFSGIVRDVSDGRPVSGLTYEAYRERAAGQLAELAREVGRQWPVAAVWLEHRLGALAPSEVAVVAGVAAPHREEAFAASRWAIDELKATVAIWKQEHWADGTSRWPGAP